MSAFEYCAENRGRERKTEVHIKYFHLGLGIVVLMRITFFSQMLQVANIANNKKTLSATYIDCDVSRLRFVAYSKCKITISKSSNRTS